MDLKQYYEYDYADKEYYEFNKPRITTVEDWKKYYQEKLHITQKDLILFKMFW